MAIAAECILPIAASIYFPSDRIVGSLKRGYKVTPQNAISAICSNDWKWWKDDCLPVLMLSIPTPTPTPTLTYNRLSLNSVLLINGHVDKGSSFYGLNMKLNYSTRSSG